MNIRTCVCVYEGHLKNLQLNLYTCNIKQKVKRKEKKDKEKIAAIFSNDPNIFL